ncbi:ATP synthase subunit O, mitochondrial [Sitodiplosis mosellana]|uniref:ATP synthase subunit O, mitochondrial n=1 Tax=Sitodiplosis mosellana TaxID=263140 RepID=UPI002443B4B2|nr:ATP synthase subunit O, mitochondrial [Sitodiplosis mosellana]
MASRLGMTVRSMSSSAAAVKPPIQLFGLEGRYATALYTAATKMGQLDSAEKELISVQNAIKGKPQLRAIITSPIINRTLLQSTLRDVGAKANLSTATTNLLALLAENGRMGKIDGVINAFKQLMSAHRGEVICEVTTARPLSDGQRKQLQSSLAKFVKSNQTIQLKEKVDPAIIGGLVASIGDNYVDMSVASKIKKYKELIESAA